MSETQPLPFEERENFLMSSLDLQDRSSESFTKPTALSNSNKENSSSRVTEKRTPSLIDKSIEINFSSQRVHQNKPSEYSEQTPLDRDFFKSSTANLEGEIESPLVRLGNSQVSELKNERSMSCFENESSKATPHSLNQSKQKVSHIGGILLAMSGQYYLANGSQTPNTYDSKINNRRYIASLSGSKEVKRKMKKGSINHSKSRKLPIYPSDSLFVEREDVEGIGRMQYTIKAYFPKKDQVKKFKHNIRKLRSTSVVNQRLAPTHCQSQNHLDSQYIPTPAISGYSQIPEYQGFTDSFDRGPIKPLPQPPKQKKQSTMRSPASKVTTTNLYIPI